MQTFQHYRFQHCIFFKQSDGSVIGPEQTLTSINIVGLRRHFFNLHASGHHMGILLLPVVIMS